MIVRSGMSGCSFAETQDDCCDELREAKDRTWAAAKGLLRIRSTAVTSSGYEGAYHPGTKAQSRLLPSCASPETWGNQEFGGQKGDILSIVEQRKKTP